MSGFCLAATVNSFGGADQIQLRELPLPQPARGEIVVRVDAAAVNPIDTRRRAGYGRRLLSLMGAARLPLVLGNDFAGTVCAVGRDVNAFRAGDAVFGAKPPSSRGTHATHVAVDARYAQHQPPGMSAEQLAVLPYNFLTVTHALSGAGITRSAINGRRVLVHGASGGLGLIALHLLHGMGALVTAVASGVNRQHCLQAGATDVVDRHIASLHTLPQDYVAVLNFANWEDEASLLRLLMPGALGYATTVHPLLGLLDRHGLAGGLTSAWFMKRRMAAHVPRGARYAWTVFRPDRAALCSLAEYAPLLNLPVAPARFRLAEAAQAHRHVELHQPGRAILLPHLT
jgi:NADPH:quinone reductase-like Zn-dependent oxidoreductase